MQKSFINDSFSYFFEINIMLLKYLQMSLSEEKICENGCGRSI